MRGAYQKTKAVAVGSSLTMTKPNSSDWARAQDSSNTPPATADNRTVNNNVIQGGQQDGNGSTSANNAGTATASGVNATGGTNAHGEVNIERANITARHNDTPDAGCQAMQPTPPAAAQSKASAVKPSETTRPRHHHRRRVLHPAEIPITAAKTLDPTNK